MTFEVLPLETMNAVYPWFLGGMYLGKGTFQQATDGRVKHFEWDFEVETKVLAPQTSSGYLSLGLLHLCEFVSPSEFWELWRRLAVPLLQSDFVIFWWCCAMSSVRLNLQAYYLAWHKYEIHWFFKETSISSNRLRFLSSSYFSCCFAHICWLYYHPKLIL